MESKSLHHGGHIGLHDLHHDHLISTKVAVLSTQNNMIIRHLLVSCLLNHTVPSLLQGGFVCCQINLRVASQSGEQNRNKNIYRSQKIVEEVQFCCVSKNLDLRHVPSIELHKVDRPLV